MVVFDTPNPATVALRALPREITVLPTPLMSQNAVPQSMVQNSPYLMSIATLEGMAHAFGYARVSTTDQDARLQHDALTAAGCYRIFTDTASGALQTRPELAKLLDQLRPGDTLVVWRLDRLGRSIRHLIDQLSDLQDRASNSDRSRKTSTPPLPAAG